MAEQASDFSGHDEIIELYNKAQHVLGQLREQGIDSQTGEKMAPRFAISKAAELVGRGASAIREAEKEGRLPQRERTATNRRVNYTLADLNHMREVFGTRPWRDPADPLAILAVQNFKGGVGKSTIAVHLAQYLAIRGYRVLLLDCDSQASTTMMFGLVPDRDIDENATLYGYLHDEGMIGLKPLLRRTHFDNLWLLPANLKLYNAEYEIAGYIAQHGREGYAFIDKIGEAIATVADDFDIVILDPPPALGMISLSVLTAANAMVIPMPPSMIDFSSTASFLSMLASTMQQLARLRGKSPIYNFVRLVASKADDNKSMHREIIKMAQRLFGSAMLRASLKDSAEIDNASSRLSTVYELDRPITSHEVHSRCVGHLNAVNSEIELEIRRTWPSHAAALRKEGLI
jgi:chromosome partitioning protein